MRASTDSRNSTSLSATRKNAGTRGRVRRAPHNHLGTAATIFLLLFAAVGPTTFASNGPAAEEVTTFYAFSLQTAQKHLCGKGIGDRQLAERLGGITRVTGLVVDPQTRDCIVVGRIDDSRREMRLEDLVVMLRSVFLYDDGEVPGVSIDPHPDTPLSAPQHVRYLGRIERTRAGMICFQADLLMKRIGLGLQPARVEGVETYFDKAVEEAREAGRNRCEVLSRFWYFPMVSRVVMVGNGVLLAESQLAVLTEVLSAREDGESVKDLEDYYHQPSERFAESFSKHFDQLADTWPVIEDLCGLAELWALSNNLAKSDAQADLSYWLHEYEVPVVETPLEVPLLRNANIFVRLEILGGVHLQSLSMRLKEGDWNGFSKAVLEARPRSDALIWPIHVTDEGDIFVPPPMDRLQLASAADAYARGLHFFSGGRYDEAISAWLQVTRTFPESGEAYYLVGRAFERKGMMACAGDYYSKAMHFDPFIKNSRFWDRPSTPDPQKEVLP